jgi:tetrahydromethanopterin S-methyltransferase subunit G
VVEITEKSHVFFDGFVVSIELEDHLLERKVEKQQKRIDILEKKLDGCVTVVYQLLGGLYNQRTQGKRLDGYISMLFDRQISSEREDTGSEWPTTRQGDKTEEKLEKVIEELRKRIPDIDV